MNPYELYKVGNVIKDFRDDLWAVRKAADNGGYFLEQINATDEFTPCQPTLRALADRYYEADDSLYKP